MAQCEGMALLAEFRLPRNAGIDWAEVRGAALSRRHGVLFISAAQTLASTSAHKVYSGSRAQAAALAFLAFDNRNGLRGSHAREEWPWARFWKLRPRIKVA